MTEEGTEQSLYSWIWNPDQNYRLQLVFEDDVKDHFNFHKDIENIEIPYVRAEFRKLFFEVGGVMPKGKGIKI